jgi:hypothetical protein
LLVNLILFELDSSVLSDLYVFSKERDAGCSDIIEKRLSSLLVETCGWWSVVLKFVGVLSEAQINIGLGWQGRSTELIAVAWQNSEKQAGR